MPVGGSIVNVTSIEAHRAAARLRHLYAAMKAAVESLTKALALSSRRPAGSAVNTIAPDAIPTSGDEVNAEAVGSDRAAYDKKVPLGWGTVDDCAGPIVFLSRPTLGLHERHHAPRRRRQPCRQRLGPPRRRTHVP